MASKAWDDNRFRVPVLMSGSVTSISDIMSSISSLLTRPKYLLGVDSSLVGNLKIASFIQLQRKCYQSNLASPVLRMSGVRDSQVRQHILDGEVCLTEVPVE